MRSASFNTTSSRTSLSTARSRISKALGSKQAFLPTPPPNSIRSSPVRTKSWSVGVSTSVSYHKALSSPDFKSREELLSREKALHLSQELELAEHRDTSLCKHVDVVTRRDSFSSGIKAAAKGKMAQRSTQKQLTASTSTKSQRSTNSSKQGNFQKQQKSMDKKKRSKSVPPPPPPQSSMDETMQHLLQLAHTHNENNPNTANSSSRAQPVAESIKRKLRRHSKSIEWEQAASPPLRPPRSSLHTAPNTSKANKKPVVDEIKKKLRRNSKSMDWELAATPPLRPPTRRASVRDSTVVVEPMHLERYIDKTTTAHHQTINPFHAPIQVTSSLAEDQFDTHPYKLPKSEWKEWNTNTTTTTTKHGSQASLASNSSTAMSSLTFSPNSNSDTSDQSFFSTNACLHEMANTTTTTTDATTISAAYLTEVADAPLVIATSSIASGKQGSSSSREISGDFFNSIIVSKKLPPPYKNERLSSARKKKRLLEERLCMSKQISSPTNKTVSSSFSSLDRRSLPPTLSSRMSSSPSKQLSIDVHAEPCHQTPSRVVSPRFSSGKEITIQNSTTSLMASPKKVANAPMPKLLKLSPPSSLGGRIDWSNGGGGGGGGRRIDWSSATEEDPWMSRDRRKSESMLC